MTIDAGIVSGLQPVRMPDQLNMLAQAMTVKNASNQNALAQYGLAKAQRQDSQMNSLMSALQSNGVDLSTPEGQAKAFSIAPEAAGPLIKNMMEARQAQSMVGKNNSESGKFDAETVAKRADFFRSRIPTDPTSAADWVRAQYADPVLGKVVSSMGPVESAVASIPKDPQGFQNWVNQNALGMQKFIELNAPKTSTVNTGGATNLVQTPGLGGAPTVAGTFTNTQSPDNAATNATSRANNAATNATSRANNADTIRKDYAVVGVDPNSPGSVDANSERTAQAIAAGQLPAPTGMALLNPKNQRILGRVMEINPNYDYTSVTAKKAAATAFTTGSQGNALRSVSTANAHLDQLNELVDGLQNGNTQVVNKVQNYFSQQTGNPNVTNFDAIKNIVGQEVVKAIVAGGGGVGEREEAAKIFSSANSPAQLKGAIQHYRMVMGAQQQNLLEQRRAAGLSDSTLPSYSGGGGATSAPNMPATSAIDAELARRAGKK